MVMMMSMRHIAHNCHSRSVCISCKLFIRFSCFSIPRSIKNPSNLLWQTDIKATLLIASINNMRKSISIWTININSMLGTTHLRYLNSMTMGLNMLMLMFGAMAVLRRGQSLLSIVIVHFLGFFV